MLSCPPDRDLFHRKISGSVLPVNPYRDTF
jgi:hypothetical protein